LSLRHQRLQDVLKEYQLEQQKLVELHHQEQIQFQTKYPVEDEGMKKVQVEQEEETKALQLKHQKEQEVLSRQLESEKQELETSLQNLSWSNPTPSESTKNQE